MSFNQYLALLLAPLGLCFALSVSACTDDLVVSNAFIRGLPSSQTVTAAFMTLSNPTDKDCRLTGATSPIASSAEIHTHSHSNGVMSMRPVDEVLIPAGETVSFQSGGYHLMLFGLKNSLKDGDEYPVTFFFDGCPELKIMVPVRSVLNEVGS